MNCRWSETVPLMTYSVRFGGWTIHGNLKRSMMIMVQLTTFIYLLLQQLFLLILCAWLWWYVVTFCAHFISEFSLDGYSLSSSTSIEKIKDHEVLIMFLTNNYMFNNNTDFVEQELKVNCTLAEKGRPESPIENVSYITVSEHNYK